jgi:hypothetical protein
MEHEASYLWALSQTRSYFFNVILPSTCTSSKLSLSFRGLRPININKRNAFYAQRERIESTDDVGFNPSTQRHYCRLIYYLYIHSYMFRSYDHHQAEKYIYITTLR